MFRWPTKAIMPSFSDIDHTCAHDETSRSAHPTGLELVIGSLLGGAIATGILAWLLGVA